VYSPGAVTAAKLVQLPSGVAVSPVRSKMAMLVPDGVRPCQVIVAQSTALCASKTRDTNDPVVEYGVRRIQLTTMLPPTGLKSLAAIGRISVPIGTAWDATSTPSIE
jgi:hypothetical protein